MNSNSKGISLATLLPSIVVAVMIGVGLMFAMSVNLTNFSDQVNSTSKDADQKIDNNLKFDPDKGAGTGSGEGSDVKVPGSGEVSDNVSIDLVEETFFTATKDREESYFEGEVSDPEEKAKKFDNWYQLLEKGTPSGSDNLEYVLKTDELVGKFGSDYNKEAPERSSDIGGGPPRYIWIKNKQNGENTTSIVQEGYKGRIYTPHQDRNSHKGFETVNEENTGQAGASFKFNLKEIDWIWDWSTGNLTKNGGSSEEKLTDLYPGDNKFNVKVIENSTDGKMAEANFNIKKPYKYKIYYVNENGASTKLGQPSKKPAWFYKNGDSTSKKTKVVWESKKESNIDVASKFVAKFPETEEKNQYKLTVDKEEGKGSNRVGNTGGNLNVDKSSGNGGSNKIVISSEDVEYPVENCEEIGDPDAWGLECDRNDNGVSDFEESSIKVRLEHGEGSDEDGEIISKEFEFTHWGCVESSNEQCLSPQ